MMQQPLRRYLPLLLVALLSACGGGGEDSGEESKPVIANRPSSVLDLAVYEGDTVYLSDPAGDSGSGDIISYHWEQTGGIEVMLSNATTATASFTAPDVSTDQTLTFRLSVTDNDGASAISEARVTVLQIESATLTVSVFGEGELAVVGTSAQLDCNAATLCEGIFDRGSNVVIEANPAADWVHERWVGCDQSIGNQCTVSLDDDRRLSVTFLTVEPPELEDDVVVLDDDRLRKIIEYDATTGLLTVETDMPGVNEWIVGDILLSDGFDSDPERSLSFARRITRIDNPLSAPHRIHTEQASLDDLFRSGSLSYRGQIQDVTASDISRSDSVIVSQDDPEFPGMFVLQVAFPLADHVSVSGKIGFLIDTEFDLNFDPLEARFLTHAQTNGALAVSIGSLAVSTDGMLSLQTKKKLPLELRLPAILIPVPPAVIVITPTIETFLTLEVAADIGMTPRVTYTVSTTAGAHYVRGEGTTPIFGADVVPVFDLGDATFSDSELTVEAGIEGELELLIYGAVGPVATFGPYVGVTTGVCAADVYAGASLGVGGVLDLVVAELQYDVPVWDRRWNVSRINFRSDADDGPEILVSDLRISDHADFAPLFLNLSWSTPQNNCDVAGYSVYRNGRAIARNIATTTSNVMEFRDDGPFIIQSEQEQDFCYRVAAIRPSGREGSLSGAVCASTYFAEIESETPDLVGGGNTGVVEWFPPSNAELVTEYVVYRHTDTGRSPIATLRAPCEEERFGHRSCAIGFDASDLTPDNIYCFSVDAVYPQYSRNSGVHCQYNNEHPPSNPEDWLTTEELGQFESARLRCDQAKANVGTYLQADTDGRRRLAPDLACDNSRYIRARIYEELQCTELYDFNHEMMLSSVEAGNMISGNISYSPDSRSSWYVDGLRNGLTDPNSVASHTTPDECPCDSPFCSE